MKKIVTAILSVVIILSLSACGASQSEVDALKARVGELETQVAELNATQGETPTREVATHETQEEPITTEPTAEETEETEAPELDPIEPQEAEIVKINATSATPEMLQLLETQISSTYYADWFQVAECEYATADQLKRIATKTASINNYDWAKDITEALVNNPNTTNDIMLALAHSKYTFVTEAAHQFIEKNT